MEALETQLSQGRPLADRDSRIRSLFRRGDCYQDIFLSFRLSRHPCEEELEEERCAFEFSLNVAKDVVKTFRAVVMKITQQCPRMTMIYRLKATLHSQFIASVCK